MAVSQVDSDETHEEEIGPRAYLDLVAFAARLVAYVAWLANETFRTLDPASDERVPDHDRCREAPTGCWSGQPGSVQTVATSGVSGLVDWAG